MEGRRVSGRSLFASRVVAKSRRWLLWRQTHDDCFQAVGRATLRGIKRLASIMKHLETGFRVANGCQTGLCGGHCGRGREDG